MYGTLDFKPIAENTDLLGESVLKASQTLPGLMVAEIDPQYMNGTDLSDHYGTNPEDGANCIVVRGKDGQTAAVLVPVGYRADLNGIVRTTLGTKVSMAPLEEVLKETDMEYGSITPIGLPDMYRILIDSRLMQKQEIIVGGGKQKSKLLVPTAVFQSMPNVQIIEGLGQSQAA